MQFKPKKINSIMVSFIMFLSCFVVFQIINLLLVLSYSNEVNLRQVVQASDNVLNIYARDIISATQVAEDNLNKIIDSKDIIENIVDNSSISSYRAKYQTLSILESFMSENNLVDAYIVSGSKSDTFLMARSSRIPYNSIDSIQQFSTEVAVDESTNSVDWHIINLDSDYYLTRYFNLSGISVLSIIKLSSIISENNNILNDNQGVLLVDSFTNSIYSHGAEKYVLPDFIDANSEYVKTSNGILVTSVLPHNNLSLIVMTQEIGFTIQTAAIYLVCFILLALVFILFFAFYLKKEVVTPMNTFMQTIKSVEKGEYNNRPKLTCHNKEFNALERAFSSMLDMIVKLRIESYEQIISKQDIELRYLQMQIKPHFFLNALSTIHGMSIVKDGEKIREFIKALSATVRYTFRTGLNLATVKDEIAHIENFLQCENILYPGCIFHYIEAEPETENNKIPQMMLHTFVENTFKHNLSINEVISVFIRFRSVIENGEVVTEIVVEDDGKGFPEEILLNGVSLKGNGYGLGITNITRTLQLMYGRSDLITLSNKPDRGSMVKIIIPNQRGIK